MMEKIMKAVKSNNKKRGRNITIGAIVGILLSYTSVMEAAGETGLKIANDGKGKIEFDKDGNKFTPEPEPENEDNPYPENIWKDTIYTNNAAILGKSEGIYLNAEIDIINNGVISTVDVGQGHGIRNGSKVGDTTNNGIIKAEGNGYQVLGINFTNPAGKIVNSGLISGSTGLDASDKGGYGMKISSPTGDITNSGTISGRGYFGAGIESSTNIPNIVNSGLISAIGATNGGYGGHGISLAGYSEADTLTNSGVVYGNTYAIRVAASSTVVRKADNYGLLISDGEPTTNYITTIDLSEAYANNKMKNYGLAVIVTSEGYKISDTDYKNLFGVKTEVSGSDYIVVNIKATKGTDKKIENMESLVLKEGTLTYGDSETEVISSDKKYVLNGIEDTLKINGGKNELNSSIVNAYKTAVVMNEDMSTLTLDNTVINGNVLGGAAGSTVSIGGTKTALTLKGNSVINAKDGANAITVTGNDNTITLEGNAIVNGEMESKGNNILSLYGKTNGSMNMLHNISGFANMNIDNNVTFFEDVKIKGVDTLTIAETGVLNLRLKNTETTATVEGSPIPKAEHAFLGNNMIIQGEGNGIDIAGTLNFVTNRIGKRIYVDMKDVELKNLYIKTSSIIDGYEIDENVSIILGAYGNLNEIYRAENTRAKDLSKKRYESLNNIYKGIHSSKEENLNALRTLISFNNFGNNYEENMSDEEQLKNLMSYLNSIYTESPYSFSSELSRRSAGMFRDIVVDNIFKPETNKWLIMGGLTHVDGGTKDTYYGQNYHEVDTGTSDTEADIKLTGAYMLGKYGYSENLTLGITVGGNKSEAEISMSKVKGNSGYLGAFAENYRGNLTLKAGAGIQYSEYDADRRTVGDSYNDKYSDMTYDIYLNGRYSNPIGENLFLEPYATLSYTYVDQDGADEGSKDLSLKTDSKSFDYTVGKVGVDLKKVIPHEKGKSTLSAGVSYTRILNGADEEYITGKFKGESAKNFDILVAHKNEHSIGLNAKYALELENGVIFDVKGTYSVERDSNNQSGKNRTKGEWIVGVGLGYKF